MKKSALLFGAIALTLTLAACSSPATTEEQIIDDVITDGVTINGEAAPAGTIQISLDATTLLDFDGQNGNPMYVAYNGKVYDVTNHEEWADGEYQGQKVGTDLTAGLENSSDVETMFADLPIVGEYVG